MTTTLIAPDATQPTAPTTGGGTDPAVPGGGRWTFLSRSSLPTDPTARRLEKRGRWWLALSYVLCPCHLPVTLGLAGVVFGGTALGSAIAGHAVWVGVLLTALYGVVLWRGFRQIRMAKRALAAGETLSCSPTGCEIVPAPADGVG